MLKMLSAVSFRIAVVTMVTVLVFSGFTSPVKAQKGNDQELAPLLDSGWLDKGNPKLDSRLNQLVSSANNTQQMRAVTQQSGISADGNSVRVVIESLPGLVQEAAGLAQSLGQVENTYGELIQVRVPVTALETLASSNATSFVRLPYQPMPEIVTSEGVGLIEADDWQSAGLDGTGVRVAILDTGFQGYPALLGTELPASVTVQSFSGDITGGGQVHGTACAEIVHDVAPGAQLYLVNFSTEVEFGIAVDWLIGQGVNIISSSVGWPAAGPGDGTGPINTIVSRAKNAGILWCQSAGNNAQQHWSGHFVDIGGNGWNNFNESPLIDEGQTIVVTSGQQIGAWLTWNDPWGSASNDYDLFLIDSSDQIVMGSVNVQSGAGYPYEGFTYAAAYDGVYSIGIRRNTGNRSIQLQLFSSCNLQYLVSAGSIVVPGDSLNVMTVGAVFWNDCRKLEPFSSMGPTTDSRIKPDLLAPDGASTVSYGKNNGTKGGTGFFGTSAAAPHAAGTAALVKQVYRNYSTDQMQDFLEGRAIDLGIIDKDITFGSGRLCIPPPSLIDPPKFISTWGSNGSGDGQFIFPRDVAVDSSGNVYVTDPGNSRIQEFSPSGEFIRKWGTNGTGTAQFVNPSGIAVDNLGNVYVADTGNHRIQKFSNSGVFILKWGTQGNGDSQFNDPFDVAVDASGNVFVSDTLNNRIQKFTSSGVFVKQFGSPGYGDGQFYFPKGIAVDSSGDIWVADSGGGRVEEFSNEGEFITGWWGTTRGGGQFTGLMGVGVDSAGNIYVVDTHNSRIDIFTHDGCFITKWGTNGSDNGQFIDPQGIDISPSGIIYVADTYVNYRIQAFDYNKLIVTTNNATPISTTSGELNGRISNLGLAPSANVSFEWGLTSGYGNKTTPQTKTSIGSFSATVTSLSPNTTYHFRAKAVGEGTSYGEDKTFTTLSTPPSVTTGSATPDFTATRLSGSVTSMGTATSVTTRFVWGTAQNNLINTLDCQTLTANGPFSGNITGLNPATTYYYRAEAVGQGTGQGTTKSFITQSTPPSITTDNASNVGHFGAQLNGNLSALGSAPSINVSFQWGTKAGNYSGETAVQTLGAAGSFYANLSGLSENTTYYYRAKAAGHGTVYGSEKSFKTLAGGQIPTAVTDNATNVGYNAARLNCTVTSMGTVQSAEVHFVWGTSPGVYTGTSQTVPVNGTGPVSVDVGSFSASTVYYYRAHISFLFAPGDGGGFLADNERTFTTSEAPPPPPVYGGGGGGFGGSSGGGVPPGAGVTNLGIYTNSEGLFNIAGEAESEDGKVYVAIAKGVLAQTKDSAALKSLKIVAIGSPGAAPAGSQFIGLVYELTPDGATFTPGITLTLFFDPAAVPAGIDLSSLKIAVYNTATSAWEILPGIINKADSSITVNIGHFSIYAIVGSKVVPPTTPKLIPLPAKFATAELAISPVSALPGQSVEVSTKVSNTGETAGEYEVVLKVNGTVEETRKVTVGVKSSSIVTFTITRNDPGSYDVNINGATGSFSIQQAPVATTIPTTVVAPTPIKGANWPIIGLIIGGVALAGLVATVLMARGRKRAGKG